MSQGFQEIHADFVRRRKFVSRQPHDKGWCTRKKASVLRQRRLLGWIHGNHDVSDTERDRVALEKVGEVDEPFSTFGIRVRDDFVVG